MGNAVVREDPVAGTGRQCSQTHTAIFKGELSYETDDLVLQSQTGSVNVCSASWASRKMVFVIIFEVERQWAQDTRLERVVRIEEQHQVKA